MIEASLPRVRVPDLARPLPVEVWISASVAMAVGITAMFAVLAGIPRLTSVVQNHVPVAANTGLCFVLVAVALVAAHLATPQARRAAAATATLVLLLALVTVFDISTGHALGVDGWLFPMPAGASTMSPQTAVAFALLSVGILLAPTPVGAGVVRSAASIVLVVSLINVIDVVYAVETPTLLAGQIQMALPTAGAFLGLALGVGALHPRGSLLELVRLDGPSGVLTRRLLGAALVIPIAIGWLRLVGERAGLYDTTFGVALTTVSTITLFAVAVRYTATSVERAEVKRRALEQELANALSEIEDLYDHAPIGYHSLDDEGRFLRINHTELEMFGYDREQLIGTRFADILVPASRERFAETFPLFMREGFIRNADFEVVCTDGSARPIRINASAIRDAEGRFVATRSTVLDVSEQRNAEIERERAMEEAIAANHAKSEFLSRMSHELRTPLNSVLGFAQLLEADELTAEQRESATYIRRAGRHLLELINEVLDIARIDQGTMAISVEAVAVSECLDEVCSFIGPMAASREISVDTSAVAGCDGWVLADRQRLRQVLLNLLSNAVKYNHAGGRVTVGCGLTEDGLLRINIADTGPGIPLDSLPRLFQPFDRLGAETTDVEGVGIGLALSKALVEALDGQIGVDSQPGAGSTFWVAFPATDAPDEVASHTAVAPPISADPGPRLDLLYIEDNPANLRLVERITQRMPRVRLMTAIQGGIGLELARQHRPSLILLDLHLPDMGGADVLHELRSDPATSTIPVAILTADGSESRARTLVRDGANAYLTKPIDVTEFVQVLERLIFVPTVETAD